MELYTSPLHVLTLKIAFMDHEKTRIKVKKMAKFLCLDAIFCAFSPDSRHEKDVQ